MNVFIFLFRGLRKLFAQCVLLFILITVKPAVEAARTAAFAPHSIVIVIDDRNSISRRRRAISRTYPNTAFFELAA